MAKFVRCPNCKEPIPTNYDSEFLHCEKCGKTYKNPFFGKEPQEGQPKAVSDAKPESPQTVAPQPVAQQPTAPIATVVSQPANPTPAKPPKSNHSEFQAGLMSLIGLNIVNFLIVTFSLGFATPYAICREYKWLYNHEVIDDRKLVFVGKAGSLLGQWIKWILLSVITLGIYAWLIPIRKARWIAENTHIDPYASNDQENKSHFDGTFWEYLGEGIIEALIVTFTLGLATPYVICRSYRWQLEHQLIDGQRLVFDGKAGQLFGTWIKWCLLTIITFGIYGLWLPIKKQKWLTSHTHFEN